MAVKANLHTDTVRRIITLHGLAPVMFDRYAGDNNTRLEPEQKLYLSPDGQQVIGLHAANIMSLLTSQNTVSAPKRLKDARKYRGLCNSMLSFVSIAPDFIPFLRDGKPIKFGKLNAEEKDPLSGVYIHRSVARLEKGIPNPKVRPVLPLPWSLAFNFTLFNNREIKEQEILNIMAEAGIAIGIGTYRGVFGKFEVSAE